MSAPDFSALTLSQLRDVRQLIDAEQWPDRVREIDRLILLREQQGTSLFKTRVDESVDEPMPDDHRVALAIGELALLVLFVWLVFPWLMAIIPFPLIRMLLVAGMLGWFLMGVYHLITSLDRSRQR